MTVALRVSDSPMPVRGDCDWREVSSEIYFPLNVDTSGCTRSNGTVTKKSFANLGFSRRGREGKATDGDVYLLNANEPYEVDIAAGSEMLCLCLPCDLVRDRVRDIDELCGASRFADPTLVRTLRQLVAGALEAPPAIDADRLQDLCLHIVDVMATGSTATLPSKSYAETMAANITKRARRVIQVHLADPSLTVAQVASEIAVSIRQLQHALQKSGTSFSGEVLDARLQRARSLLRFDDGVPRLIGTIAADCGFSSQAHFATTYRKRFGRSPRDERS